MKGRLECICVKTSLRNAARSVSRVICWSCDEKRVENECATRNESSSICIGTRSQGVVRCLAAALGENSNGRTGGSGRREPR